jgi:hypothetical protein
MDLPLYDMTGQKLAEDKITAGSGWTYAKGAETNVLVADDVAAPDCQLSCGPPPAFSQLKLHSGMEEIRGRLTVGRKYARPHAEQRGVWAQSEHFQTEEPILPPIVAIIYRYIVLDALGTSQSLQSNLHRWLKSLIP